MFDEALLQSAFDWALRFYQRKGLNAQDAEDCAAEVRLHLLQHLQQGRPLSFAYAVQVAQGVLADFVAAQQRRFQTVPLEHADSCGGAGRAVSGAAGGYPLGVGATAP
jgi:DNA-directed RNA polymerase specialized sigma24 family protein